jgi:hypothetical protein
MTSIVAAMGTGEFRAKARSLASPSSAPPESGGRILSRKLRSPQHNGDG